jgi:hypothetical protein
MFRKWSWIFAAARLVLLTLLASPCATLAQRGAGGGRTGGGLAGGGGLASVAKSTGVDEKDDLKDFHAALAIQATSQQIIQYASMLKSSEAASAELKSFLDRLGQQGNGSGLATPLGLAIEKARTENSAFLDGLSDQQKSGLREIVKSLFKDDSDLAQQTKDLTAKVGDTKATGQPVATAAQNLDHALETFHGRQIDLGEEMSIAAGSHRQDFTFALAAVKNSITFASQPVVVATSGVISGSRVGGGQNVFRLDLTTDLSDLQRNITGVLRAQLNKSDRCGERVEILDATLAPRPPASLVSVRLHYERWACRGRESNEMAEGNGTVEVKLTPSVADDRTLRLSGEIGRIDAETLVGEMLRSGSLGDSLRDRISETLLSAMHPAANFKALLPPSAQSFATLQHAQFQGTGMGRINFLLEGEIRLSAEQAALFTKELRGQTSSPETPQQALSR